MRHSIARTCVLSLFTLVGVIGVSCAEHEAPVAAREVVPWRADVATARDEAGKSHKVVLVDFFATWCGPCKEMARTTWTDPKVAEAMGGVVPVQVDIDRHPDLASQYSIDAVPTLMLMDDKGTMIRSQSGGLSADEFIAWLKGK
jgi:thiol:disulfide interchange protein